MVWRPAHGAGAPALSRVEVLSADELPPLNPADTVEALRRSPQGKPFQKGNQVAKGRKPALASIAGMPLDATDPLYKRALSWARSYRLRRISELAIQHGGNLSAGVCAMITSSALDMAASRYLSAKSAVTGDTDMLIAASRLAQSSRQQELTALEIAAREAAARPRAPVDYRANIGALVESPKK